MADGTMIVDGVTYQSNPYSVVKFTNIDSEDFIGEYGGQKSLIRSGKTVMLPQTIAMAYSFHLAHKIITREGLTVDNKRYGECLDLILNKKAFVKVQPKKETITELLESGESVDVEINLSDLSDSKGKIKTTIVNKQEEKEDLTSDIEEVEELEYLEDETNQEEQGLVSDEYTEGEEIIDLDRMNKLDLIEYGNSVGITAYDEYKETKMKQEVRQQLINDILEING